ncbi:MAG: ribosome recycling factor [Alkalibacterium sp.]|uniref:ribosome recycling factor n=1 Tax=Alkalibacterium TaxID=99906 RepID=UPI000EEB5239|nr:ribosome recycling factor [Alkalibacterium sp.]MDN6194169.1 ribosome recycling factor [Alkalibacterium sp.]MDN6293090.1 ribosome recycling factor [Alkalibacterium sp.]MDN6294749.1 ribosome recycling factor [Alkalibacterium sp.]MDN6326965.1 ribosome recycling factor [Alkalibacterium sp.]MDN6397937.1 ribosome recycling factor [Alkalibacterium sp.]
MTQEILKDAKLRMKQSEQSYLRELGTIRAGRANPSLLNRVNVEYYGAPTPLNQLAQISVPEARVLLITPYDKSSLGNIEKSLNQSDIGIPPSNDGNVIRLVVPALTEERRKDIAKQVGKEAESAKIAIRNIRRDAMDSLKKAEKASDITEDELRQYEEDVQKLTDASVKEIDKLSNEKEKEIIEG